MAQKQFKIGLSNTDKQNMAQDVYERLLALTFPEYETTESYEIGDFVVYNDQLYKCIGATSGAWDSTKWQLATLNDLVTDIENAVAFVNDKANVDGNYPTMTVGVADNLSPYDEETGIKQSAPFNFQASGTNNGADPLATVGELALLQEKQGNTVVVNQLLQYGDFSQGTTGWTTNGTTLSVSNKVATILGSGGSSNSIYSSGSSAIIGHKYLLHYTAKADSNINCGIGYAGVYSTSYFAIPTTNKECFRIIEATSTNGTFYIYNTNEVNLYTFNVFVIDLTQWFNGDIPQDILDNPDHFFRYYQGSLAYNEGTLVNTDGRYIKCIGMNQFDGTNDVKAIPNATYYINGSATLTYKDREGNTISSESKSNETFVAPSNCLSIGVNGSGNISINLYYEDEPRCLNYEPYQVLTNNDTGTEILRSAGSVKDSKTPDGTITRRIGYVDMGTLTWDYNDTYQVFTATVNGMKFDADNIYNCVTSKYSNSGVSSSGDSPDKTFYPRTTNTLVGIGVKDSAYNDAAAFKTAMSGVYLFYELAEPTTEQGTPYSENLVIDDFGSMDFGGTNGVPQGALIFYPVDYKAYLDTLHKYTDGDPDNLALKSDLPTAPQSWAESLPGYDATKTQTLKNVEGTLTWVDD